MSSPEPERRRAERKVLRTKALVILGNAQPFEVRTLDLSATGMSIVASANPKPGTVLNIRLSIPVRTGGNTPFEAKARVVHSVFSSAESGFKIGLSFTELSAVAASAILKFLG
jgi:c-di-GMP-binding flagellar brake protein YcgR